MILPFINKLMVPPPPPSPYFQIKTVSLPSSGLNIKKYYNYVRGSLQCISVAIHHYKYNKELTCIWRQDDKRFLEY